MKKLGSLLLAAAGICVLSSCSGQDDKVDTRSVQDAQMNSIREAYSGYEELQGKDLGVIKLPDTIDPQDTSTVYSFSARIHQRDSSEKNQEYAQKLYAGFFGDDYDASKGRFDELNYYFKYYEGDTELGRYADGMIALVKKDYIISNEEQMHEVFKADDKGQIPLGKASCSISEAAECVKSFLDNELPDTFSDFTIEPQDIFPRKNGDSNVVLVNCVQKYQGIPFEEYPSDYVIQGFDNEGNETLTSYYATDIRFTLNDKNSIAWVHIDRPIEITKKEKLSEIIPLKKAADILCSELAEYSKYEFDEVKLMYCSKKTYTSYDYSKMTPEQQLEKSDELNKIEDEYYPTWCFIANNSLSGYSRRIVKVNAVTGEITIAAPDGTAEMRAS